jgi:hypothetical protein
MEPFSTLNCLTLSTQPEVALLCDDVLARLNFKNWICSPGKDATEVLKRRKFDLVIIEGANDQRPLNASRGTSRSRRTPIVLKIVDKAPPLAERSASGAHYLERPVRFDSLAAAVKSARSLVLQEQRSWDRFGTYLSGVVKGKGEGEVAVTVVDISEGGACILLKECLQVHDHIELVVGLAPTKQLRVDATVVWTNSHGQVGLRFTYMDPKDLQTLRAWIFNQ